MQLSYIPTLIEDVKMVSAIQVSNLVKTVNNKSILAGLDLTVPQGAMVALQAQGSPRYYAIWLD